MYATDLVVDEKSNAEDASRTAHETWINDWKFFTSDEKMTSSQFDGSFSGMKLPKGTIDKLYFKNAVRWLNIFEKNN